MTRRSAGNSSSTEQRHLDTRLGRNRRGKASVSVWKTGNNTGSEQKVPFYSRGRRDWIISLSILVIIVAGIYVAYRLAEQKQRGGNINDLFKPKKVQDGVFFTASGDLSSGGKLLLISVLLFITLVLWGLYFTEAGERARLRLAGLSGDSPSPDEKPKPPTKPKRKKSRLGKLGSQFGSLVRRKSKKFDPRINDQSLGTLEQKLGLASLTNSEQWKDLKEKVRSNTPLSEDDLKNVYWGSYSGYGVRFTDIVAAIKYVKEHPDADRDTVQKNIDVTLVHKYNEDTITMPLSDLKKF